jgi:hypothetical protein
MGEMELNCQERPPSVRSNICYDEVFQIYLQLHLHVGHLGIGTQRNVWLEDMYLSTMIRTQVGTVAHDVQSLLGIHLGTFTQ